MKKVAISAIAIGIALFNSLPVSAAIIRLYEPGVGLTPNTSTTDSGPYLVFGQSGGGTQTSLDGAGTNLNTTNANATAAGYSNRGVILGNPATPGTFVNGAFPSLDRSGGYSLKFNVAVLDEFSNSSDRAGFSVIVLSSDAQGIEIGFQIDPVPALVPANGNPIQNGSGGTIFAQNSNFTKGESTAININIFTTATDYELAIFNSDYTLSANKTQILTGNLRSYNAAALFNPYQTPDFIFLGDNTSQSQANINLGAVSLTTTAIPFEFSPALGLLALGAWAIAKQVKGKKSKKS